MMLYIIDMNTGYTGSVISSMSRPPYVDYSGSLYNEGKENLTFNQYKKLSQNQDKHLISVTEKQIDLMSEHYNKKEYTNNPAMEVSEADYWEMLEVLHPEKYTKDAGFEHFRMMEYTTGTITAQYATNGEKYLTKHINVLDKSTWIKLSDFI